jgi:predicted signal transduction protein with EAL and GGDEF domain
MGGAATSDSGSAIAQIVVARREQIFVRVGLCVVIALVFQILTGALPAAAWAATYIALQAVEYKIFQRVTETRPLSPPGRIGFLAIMVTSNLVFAFFGLMESSGAAAWGVVCAGLLWSGAILNGAIVSGESRIALAASIVPPLLYFLSVPYFVIENGGALSAGIAIVLAGLLNGAAAIAIWSAGRKLTQGIALERETSRLTLLDPETGLPNRQALQRDIADRPIADRHDSIVVAAISIDRFEYLRGAIGNALMLDVIREVAARVSKAHEGAMLVRLSMDTLGVRFNHCEMAQAHRAATSLHFALMSPVRLREHKIDIRATIGLSESADAIESTTEVSIIDRAMTAVEQARAANKPIGQFDRALYGNPASNLSLMSEMQRAFENGQMSLSYQPQYDLRSAKTVGIEALIRWTHPERGPLGPDLFVVMAEETGHIAMLTDWVLRHAIEDQRRLRAAGHDLRLSINWSGRLIDDEAFTDKALALIAHASGKICIEITETGVIGNPRLARQTLDHFRAAGVAISIDDYGSGLSSLAYLRTIPADELKVDRVFVMNMAIDPTDALLVRAAITLAHSLKLQAVAEGVENGGAYELLHAMGCDLVQGYFIARPMPLAELMVFLARGERVAGQKLVG